MDSESVSDCEILIESATATESETSSNPEPSTATEEPRRKKKKKCALMELIGNKFQSENEQTIDKTTFKDMVQSELITPLQN